jgi:eukaryotic-like serine/threonine-protein kinase
MKDWTTERIRAASDLLDEALELDVEARIGWLAALTIKDRAVATDVEHLLSLGSALGDQRFLESNPASTYASKGISGMRLGAYELVEPLGHGGSGSVWRARRVDGRFEGEFAIKLLNLALIGHTSEARFRREGNILAGLKHPNIAQLADAGVSPTGQPFLVLEYVDGEPIDTYCDRHMLTVQKRLELFLDALDGVAHLHSNLIVHRDLKPSNVMVSQSGQVKLLDFGIAKILDVGDDKHPATQLTRAESGPLTPEYAAPEQIEGSTVTTATDVYALGTLLYVLLCGRHPISDRNATPAQSMQSLLHNSPKRLFDAVSQNWRTTAQEAEQIAIQRATTVKRLAASMSGDLDNILEKALKKEHAERYRTVTEFADDIRRHLNFEPIRARKDSAWYRMQKLMRKHRGGAVVVATFVATLTTATVITTWQMGVAQNQRTEARQQTERALASSEFFSGFIDELGSAGRPLSALEMIGRARETLEKRYSGNPGFVALMLTELAQAYAQIGSVPQDIETRKRAEYFARQSGDAGVLANVLCAAVSRDMEQRNTEQAKNRIAEAQTLLDSHAPAGIEHTTRCMRAEAAFLDWSGEYEAAVTQMKALVAFLEAAGEHTSTRYMAALNDTGYFLVGVNRPQDGIGYILRAGAILDQTGRSHSLMRIANLESEALALQRFGETKRAAAVLTESVKRQQGDDLSTPNVDSAHSAQAYGLALERLADPRAASWLLHAINLSQKSGDKNSVVDNSIWLAGMQVQAGKFADAESTLAEVFTLLRHSSPTTRRAANQRALGVQIELEIAKRNFAGARRHLDVLFNELEYPAKKTSSRLPTALHHAAVLALDVSDPTSARRYASDLLEISLKKARAPDQSAAVGSARVLLAKAALQLNDKALAMTELEQAVTSLTNGLGESHPSTIKARDLLQSAR